MEIRRPLTILQPAVFKRSKEQKKWLEEKFVLFLDHQARKTAGQFFPALYEEYFAKWPLTPTENEVNEAHGNIAVAIAAVRKEEEYVRDLSLARPVCFLIFILNSESTAGCTTVPVPSTV